MQTTLPVQQFLSDLHSRGLQLRVDNDGSDVLVLIGPALNRTNGIRRYLRERKADLVFCLRGGNTASSLETEGELPSETLPFAFNGEAALNILGFDPPANTAELLGAGDDESEIETGYIDDEEHAVKVTSALAAARAGLMPMVRVNFDPKGGHSTSDPATYLIRAIEKMQRERPVIRLLGYATYLDRTLNQRTGIDAVSDWWAGHSAGIKNEGKEGN